MKKSFKETGNNFIIILLCIVLMIALLVRIVRQNRANIKYESLDTFISDYQKDDVGTNAVKSDENEVELSYDKNGNVITLLKSIIVDKEYVLDNVTLDLNNHTLYIKSPGHIQLNNSTITNGNINIETTSDTEEYNIIDVTGESSISNLTSLLSGTYIDVYLIKVNEGSIFTIENSEIYTSTCYAHRLYSIYSEGDTTVSNTILRLYNLSEEQEKKTYCSAIVSKQKSLKVHNCNIITENHSKYGASYGIYSTIDSTILDIRGCDIYCDSRYLLLNGTYGSIAVGIIANSEETIINECSVRGVHSGAQIGSITASVSKSAFKSTGHGGIYFAQSRRKDDNDSILPATYRVTDTTIAWCEPDGLFKQDVSDSAFCGNNRAAFYIGGSASGINISVYMDGCKIYGDLYSGVMRGTSGEHDNSLYVSNTEFDTPMRIDNETLEFQIGKGCNITYDTTFNWCKQGLIKYSDLPDSLIFFMPEKEFR